MPTPYSAPGVYIEEVDTGSRPIEGVGTAVAAFVGFTKKGPSANGDDLGQRPRLVTSWRQFEQLYGGFADGLLTPNAVHGFFNNGGTKCWIVRVPHADGAGEEQQLALPSSSRPKATPYRLTSTTDADVAVEITHNPVPEGEGDDAVPSFNINVRSGRAEENHQDLTVGAGPRNAVDVIAAESKLVTLTLTEKGASLADRLPAAGSYQLTAVAARMLPVGVKDFSGSETDRRGIDGLAVADDVTMVMVPDLATAATKGDRLDLDLYTDVQRAVVDHCKNAKRMAVLDAPPGLTVEEVLTWRKKSNLESEFAALYYPWVLVANPDENADPAKARISLPPSGHIAGLWARSDVSRGVWKAPANEVLAGVVGVDLQVTQAEQELLNPIGVNCIRPFGTRGIRVWGARTLSANTNWRYVNVRRLFNYVEESILRGTQWVVFEPNDPFLWKRVRRTVDSFLHGLMRQGAFASSIQEQAYFVRCDEELNPIDSVREGVLVVEVGISPSIPAEFVVFRISQWDGGASAEE